MRLTTTTLAALSAVLPLPALVAAGTQYKFALEYSGEDFFDDWTFFDHFDNLTNGDVQYVSSSDASKGNLAFVNDAGNAVMRVDNSTNLSFGDKRNSIHITSKDQFKVGSVWIGDFLHVPFGCSTWPAFWSVAPDWPTGGEIDTFEGINDVKNNRMTLHTNPGCTQQNATQTSTIVNSTDCNFELDGNQGCVVTDPDPSSYGQAFVNAGGGIYVTEFALSGISIWHFNRSSIPSSLSGANVTSFDISTLGTPVANYPTTGCDVNTFFKPQNLVFDITLCGDLAGLATVFAETCPGDCYVDWVAGSPSNFDNAYFEVRSVKVFGSGAEGIDSVIQASGALPRVRVSAAMVSWATLVSLVSAAAVLTGVLA